MLILKAIYGMIKSALLWYDLFYTILSDLGFKLNPHERSITNKVTNEHQFNIWWFVDDSRVSHMDYSVNSIISDNIEENLGNYVSQQ